MEMAPIKVSNNNERNDHEIVEYDVTDNFAQYCHIVCAPVTYLASVPGILGKKTLKLEKDEAVLKTECCLCNTESRNIYSDLNGVKISNCMCFVCIEGVGNFPLCPGWGCDREIARTLLSAM